MNQIRLLTGLSLTLVLTTLPAAPAEAASPIQFGRIQYDSPGKDTARAASVNGEYVTVTNRSARPVNVTNWTIRDLADHTYRFGAYTLPARRTVVVRTGRGPNGPLVRHWNRGWHVWNNTGDKAVLRSATGSVVDTCLWLRSPGGWVNC